MPDLAAASDSGSSNTDNVTNVTTPMFTGTAEAGARAVAGRQHGAGQRHRRWLGQLVDHLQCRWPMARTILPPGPPIVAGNQTTSAALAVTIDTTAPAVSVPDLAAASDSGIVQ